MKPAARIGDRCLCMAHGGGSILARGSRSVQIEGAPAARALDLAFCPGGMMVIQEGVAQVRVGGLPIATVGSRSTHGGAVVSGASSVFVGGEMLSLEAPASALAALLGQRDAARARLTAVRNERRENARELELYERWMARKRAEHGQKADKSPDNYLLEKEWERAERGNQPGLKQVDDGWEHVGEWDYLDGKIEHHSTEELRLAQEEGQLNYEVRELDRSILTLDGQTDG